MKTTSILRSFTLLSVLALAAERALPQGNLNPPGSPAPTFKTLQQVEPCTPISSLPITLSQAGSYYLTTNLTGVAGQHGITITGSRVTLDLMGFELRGGPGPPSGILMNPATSPHILNGSIVSWGQDGINGTNGGGGTIELLRVSPSHYRRGQSHSSATARRAGACSTTTIAPGNHDAARITSPGASFASTSPWANFSF